MRTAVTFMLILPGNLFTAGAQQINFASSFVSHISLQLNIGSQGTGAEFDFSIVPKLGFRLVSTLFRYQPTFLNVSGFNSKPKVNANFSSAHIFAEFNPLKHLTGVRQDDLIAYTQTSNNEEKRYRGIGKQFVAIGKINQNYRILPLV